MCAYSTINKKVLGSTNVNERKILASDVNQIREVIQTGAKDLKTRKIAMVGNTITADNGSNWIRRNGNTFQFHNGSSWQEPETATLLTFTAGENIAARDVVYLKVSDGKIYKASTTNNDWIGVATAAITSGASGTIYPNGSLVGGFSGLTSGTWYGVGATAGALVVQTNPDFYTVGIAISATQIKIIKRETKDPINKTFKVVGEIAANNVSATSSQILNGSSLKLVDKFLDSNGQNNTVNTGTTTAKYPGVTINSFWNISTAVFTRSFSVSPKETTTTGITFKSDGTEMYVIGASSDSVHQYTLSTAWNISTAVFTKSFSVSPKETQPTGITFKSDGTEMYVIGYASNSVHQYSLGFTCYSCSYSGTFLDSIIQSVATTIPSGMTNVCCVPLMYEPLTGSDNITFDVSINGGTNYTTGIAKNTWTPITSATGTSLIVKMNLDTFNGTTTPAVAGWSVFLE